jgi:hypothetical protein
VLSRRCGVGVDERIVQGTPADPAMAVEFVEIDAEQLLADLDGEFSQLMR